MDSIIDDIINNDLLFGKDKEQGIVGAYQLSDTHIRVFNRDNGKIRCHDELFFPFFFLSDSSILNGFIPEDKEKFWLVKLGGTNYYQCLVIFRSWKNQKSALLKECLEANGFEYDSAILRLDPAEEREIRRLISDKISPIIEKAFQAGEKNLSNRERLLEALWDPTMPEAKAFVRAFGIAESEASPVFSAWKGITFYQLQVRSTSPKLKDMLAWLKSKDSTPIDAPANKAYMPQLQMFNVKIITLINQMVAEMRSILQKYETAFETFIAGNPSELTAFLRSARRVYYVLGYCISSLNSAVAIFHHAIKPPEHVRLTFDDTNQLYTRLDTTLSRRRDVPATF